MLLGEKKSHFYQAAGKVLAEMGDLTPDLSSVSDSLGNSGGRHQFLVFPFPHLYSEVVDH